jgi:ferritin-like metal-binding protein YciE
MNASQKRVVQYLGEAQATEDALVRVLESQIAMTPRGAYRTALEQHLRQTRDHADRVAQRRRELGHGGNPLTAAVGAVESVVGQALALGKTPFDLLRGSGGEEKILKNAKDAYASEALEIATYTAIERLARSVGDDETAELAASIRANEEKMLDRVLREIPKLTDAVVRAEVDGNPSFEVTATGAADAVGEAGQAAKRRHAGPGHGPSARHARPASSPASPRPRARSRAPSRPKLTWRSRATTSSPRTKSSASWPRCRRSTWPRSTRTSARTRTAPRCSTASAPSAATSRGPAMTS